MTRTVVLLALLLALLPGTAVAAEPRASFPDIEDEVMCVSCNVALNIAESPQAEQQKAFIRRLVAEGRTKQEILDELVAVYGTNVLAVPEDDGVGRAAWLVPVLAVAALAALLLLLLPRWRRRAAAQSARAGAAPAPALSADDARRLDADLGRYDR